MVRGQGHRVNWRTARALPLAMADPTADWPPRRPPATGSRVLSIGELNRLARRLLEQDLPPLAIAGEISNLARPASGHWYFSLKDSEAQVRCVMFRNANRAVRFPAANGLAVTAHGRVSLYEARGEFQFIVERLEAAGDGQLRQQFEALLARLGAEGLFAADRKRPLPALPRAIGVITSRSGAAIRDILNVLGRRFAAIPVVIYPVSVQGAAARAEIVSALATAAARRDCDVLILARGGGSLEDLWTFNEESVARAIAASPIPVVAGIGHETDVTIADLAADLRAPTPSGAAELVVPDARTWLQQGSRLAARSVTAMRRRLASEQRRQQGLIGRLRRADPGFQLRQASQRLDELRQRLTGTLNRRLGLAAARSASLAGRLRRASPLVVIGRRAERLLRAGRALRTAIRGSLRERRLYLQGLAGRLGAVSPLSTLERGYAIVRTADGRIVRAAAELTAGDAIAARLGNGELAAVVTAVTPGTTGQRTRR
jgi:exodeoxyribonuclease VII large subunit